VPDIFAQSYITKKSLEAGAAADIAVTRNHNEYIELAQRYIFAPIAVESSGCWGESSLKLVKDIGQ
jgi:hypothetical protein